MNKGTIVTDAITYIEELEKSSTDLRNRLFEMEATVVEESKLPIEAIDAAEEMKNWGIEVSSILFRNRRCFQTRISENSSSCYFLFFLKNRGVFKE